MTTVSRMVMAFVLACGTAALAAQSPVGQAPPVTMAAPIPLAAHPKGQQMMAEASKNAALLDLDFKFLDKSYENDVYAKDPLGKSHRISCVRFRSTSGFHFKVDQPKFTLTAQGLTVTENIAKLTADGLTVKVQLGPCTDVGTGVGVRVSDIKVTYKARPMVSFDQSQHCKVTWSKENDELHVSIGDLNIIGVQNDLDKLAKDAVREALNAVLDTYFSGRLRGELLKVSAGVCGGGKGLNAPAGASR